MTLKTGGYKNKLDNSLVSGGNFPNVPDPLDFLNEASSQRGGDDTKLDDIE